MAGLTLAAVVLGLALQVADGFYDPIALCGLSAALVCALAGVLAMPRTPAASAAGGVPSSADGRRTGDRALRLLLAAGIGVHVAALLTKAPGMYLEDGARTDLFRAGVLVEAALAGAGVLGLRPLVRLWFPAVLAVSLALGTWMMMASPHPQIDVVEVHRAALRALGRGRNPYRITFRNIYGANSGFYNAGAVSGDRVLFGYPYPPLSLLLAAPGQLAFKDYRYAELAALVGAAALIGYAARSVLAQLAAVLLLTTPRLFFVLEQGWTEPIAVLMLAATVFTMVRRPASSAWMGGLLAVTKQYLGLAGPLLVRFGAGQRIGAWRFCGRAAIAGAIVTLPFAVWNLRAFVDTVILLQTREPFRIDSLSYVSWAARAGWGEGSFAWAAGTAIVALAVVLRRAPNSAAGFAGGLALASLATFAMGSKAFCNYYFFVIGALCCSLAACAAPVPAREPDASPRP